jgi:hypothetical protein
MSTVWAVPTSVWAAPVTRFRQAHQILDFLRNERCSARVVEVRIFKSSRKAPIASRYWEPRSDLATVAEEITTYIADHGSVEATIVAADELYRPLSMEQRKDRGLSNTPGFNHR